MPRLRPGARPDLGNAAKTLVQMSGRPHAAVPAEPDPEPAAAPEPAGAPEPERHLHSVPQVTTPEPAPPPAPATPPPSEHAPEQREEAEPVPVGAGEAPAPASTTLQPGRRKGSTSARPAEAPPRARKGGKWEPAIAPTSWASLVSGATVTEENLPMPSDVHDAVKALSHSTRTQSRIDGTPWVSEATIRTYALAYAISAYSRGDRTWVDAAGYDGRRPDGDVMEHKGSRRPFPMAAKLVTVWSDLAFAEHPCSRRTLAAEAVRFGLAHADAWLDEAKIEKTPLRHYPSRERRKAAPPAED